MTRLTMRLFVKDRYFYGLTILGALLLGQLPILLHIWHTPSGFYYPYLDKVAFSDYYYIALTRFGMGTDWLLKIPYVVDNHQGSIIQIFFLLLGKISIISGIGPAEAIALSRIFGGMLYSFSVVLLFRFLLPKIQARFAFILFLITEPFPTINLLQPISDWGFMNWIWHFGEAVRKISVMPPHYTIGRGLVILSIYFFLIFLRNTRFRNAVISGLIMTAAGIIYPPPVFILFVSLITGFSLCVISDRKYRDFFLSKIKKRLLGLILFTLCALLPLTLLKIEIAKGFPWNRWNEVELGWNTTYMNFEANYLLMLGLPLLLIPFSLKILLVKDKRFYEKLLVFIWFLSPFLLFPFANLLRLGKFRFIEGAQIVPESILALWGFQYFLEYLSKFLKSRYVHYFKIIFITVIFGNFFLYTAASTYFSTWTLWGYNTNVYITPGELEALSFIERNVRSDSIVLADLYPSNFIPAFAQVRTVIGFPDFYKDNYDYLTDQNNINDILSGKMPENEARKYIKRRNVDFVYKQTPAANSVSLYPSLMEEIFNNKKIAIYKVK